MDEIRALHKNILSCTLCRDHGFIEKAAPVVAGRSGNRMMLIGQAPGIMELEIRRPFAGKAGRVLFRWLDSIGLDEAVFRDKVYMTAITKCYPGRATTGSGDRPPSRREIALCRPWLDAQLHIIRPSTILLVGGMAIERYLPRLPLTEVIGRKYDCAGIALVPLPHPSGASRWLNVPANKVLLHKALMLVRAEWDRVIQPLGVLPGVG